MRRFKIPAGAGRTVAAFPDSRWQGAGGRQAGWSYAITANLTRLQLGGNMDLIKGRYNSLNGRRLARPPLILNCVKG